MSKNSLVVNIKNIEQYLWEIAQQPIADKGCELIDVEYVKEGSAWVLRLFIDRENGVDHDCCGEISYLVSDLLDQNDPIPHEYSLEVSSPGMERPLKKITDYQKFAGEKVALKLYKPLNGTKEYLGVLKGINNQEDVLITVNDVELAIAVKDIAKAHLAIDFNNYFKE